MVWHDTFSWIVFFCTILIAFLISLIWFSGKYKRASVNARRYISNTSLVDLSKDLLIILLKISPFLVSFFEQFRDEANGEFNIYGSYAFLFQGLISISLLLSSEILALLSQKPNQQDSNYISGVTEAYNRWVYSSDRIEVSLSDIELTLKNQNNVKTCEEILHNQLRSIEEILEKIFTQNETGKIWINLVLPHQNGKDLVICCMNDSLKARNANGQKIPLHDKPANKIYSCVRAFLKPTDYSSINNFIYNPDVKRINYFRNKTYRSVINWLITTGDDTKAFGVVNIDAEKSYAFDLEDESSRRETAYQLCAPYLRIMALVISHKDVYANFRSA